MFRKLVIISGLLIFVQPVMAQQGFDKQGHRGCRGLMPENTIPAMKKAVDLDATLEMDISFSSDNMVIVSHDQYLSSLIALKPNGDTISKAEEKQLILYQMPYQQIEQYILGQKKYPLFPGQQQVKTHIPLLASLIDSVEAYAKQTGKPAPRYNIETKTTVVGDGVLHPGPDEFVDRLMQVILEKKIQHRVIIQSFDARTLEIVHQKYPDMQTAFLVSDGSLKQNLALLRFKPTIYSPAYKTVTEDVVKDCHTAHIKILPWTVNQPGAIKRLKDWGVDGIISDYPDRL